MAKFKISKKWCEQAAKAEHGHVVGAGPGLIKGETSCNREACQADFARFKDRGLGRWWNTSTRKWYCPYCAIKINRACQDFGEAKICFEEGTLAFTNLPKGDAP